MTVRKKTRAIMTALHLRDSPADVLRRPSHPAPDRTRTLRRRSLSPPRCLPVHGGTLDAPRLYHGYVVSRRTGKLSSFYPIYAKSQGNFLDLAVWTNPPPNFRPFLGNRTKNMTGPSGCPPEPATFKDRKKERERGRMCHCVLTVIRIPPSGEKVLYSL